MLVSDIYDEAREILANNNAAYVFRGITRAVELLAPTGLFDPLTATIDFSVNEGSFLVALPRDVKSIIKLNISNQPAFSRSRFWEFAQNSDGSVAGEEIGYTWADRGTSPIQTRASLPGVLNALATLVDDDGKTITVTGADATGRIQTETLTLSSTAPEAGTISFADITHVRREETVGDMVLQTGSNLIARYYGDETEPRYRLIKLSKSGVTCRMVYRRHTYKISSLDDVIPFDSVPALLAMLDAVSMLWKRNYEVYKEARAIAIEIASGEQKSREEHIEAGQTESQTASNQNIATIDVVIAADVYDKAAECAGPVGKQKVFDFISSAVETLSRKSQWDALLGVVDVWKPARTDTVSQFPARETGDGLFTLPRFVETPLAVNVNGATGFPRNTWFQFHLNGGAEMARSDWNTWDDMGQVCIISPIPFDAETNKKIATKVCAVPDISGDDATAIKVYGIERLSDGKEVRVVRDGVEGWICPCVNGSLDPGSGAPAFVEIDRITKGSSSAFISLFALDVTTIPATDLIPESDVTVISNDLELETESPWSGDIQSITTYGRVTMSPGGGNSYTFEIFSDSGRTVSIYSSTVDDSVPVDTRTVVFTVGASDFSSVVSGIAAIPEGVTDFTIVRTFSLEVPAAEESYTYEQGDILGYWYPDELSPTYRQIRVPTSCEARIRVKFRKRSMKVDSMFSPIMLRSRQAIEAQLMAQKAGNAGDLQSLEIWEQKATQYLKEEQSVNRPPGGFSLQFDESTMPGIGNSDGYAGWNVGYY